MTQSQTSAADCGLAVCNLSGGRGCYGLRGGEVVWGVEQEVIGVQSKSWEGEWWGWCGPVQ